METVFSLPKVKPLIKLRDYKFAGCHNTFSYISYYVRKADKFNNFDFMEAKVTELPSKRKHKKFTFTAGTSIKTIDPIMYCYLKNRKNENKDTDLIETGLNEVNLPDEIKKMYSLDIPDDIKSTDFYKKAIKDGFTPLYCKNTSKAEIKFSSVYLVLVKELKQEWVGGSLEYIVFRMAEFTHRPSYDAGKSKEKYFKLDYPDLNIPVSILK